MSLSQESPPASADPVLGEWLARRFRQVGLLLLSAHHTHVPRREDVPKPQIGDVYYFEDPAGHNYDVAITSEGWWGYKSTGWVKIA